MSVGKNAHIWHFEFNFTNILRNVINELIKNAIWIAFHNIITQLFWVMKRMGYKTPIFVISTPQWKFFKRYFWLNFNLRMNASIEFIWRFTCVNRRFYSVFPMRESFNYLFYLSPKHTINDNKFIYKLFYTYSFIDSLTARKWIL